MTPGEQIAWPVAVVAESSDDRSIVFRSYFSRRSIDGQRHLRSPILERGAAHPGDVVGRYQAALAAGDAEALVRTFAPDGYYREPIGPPLHPPRHALSSVRSSACALAPAAASAWSTAP